jgi:hypothetical protein
VAKYWSTKSAGFYDEAIHGAFGVKGSKIPKGAVEVSDEDHAALLADQGDGKRIVAGEDGAPTAVILTRSNEEILAALRAKRDRDLTASDWTQHGDNGLSDAQRQAWAAYRQQLRDYVGLVEAAIADDLDPYSVSYPTPPTIQAPPAPPGGGGDGGGGGGGHFELDEPIS